MQYIKKICLLCNTNDYTKIKFRQNFNYENLNTTVFSARRITEHYHYQILECTRCGFLFSSPILPLEVISKLYENSLQTYDNETDDIANSYMQYIVDNNTLFKCVRALEVGCGSGFMLPHLKAYGYEEVYGVEPSVEAISKAGEFKNVIFNGIIENADYPNNFFDLICCFQTLDHLVNPLETLKRIFDLLSPGGIAYIIVHNQKSLQAKIFMEKSPIYDVEHIYLFNKKTLPLICKKAGFDIVKIFDVKNIYPLSYWIKMAPIPFKNFITAVVKAVGLADKKIAIYPGNVGIFIQKPCQLN